MPTFIDDCRTDIEDYDYCGDDNYNDIYNWINGDCGQAHWQEYRIEELKQLGAPVYVESSRLLLFVIDGTAWKGHRASLAEFDQFDGPPF